MSYPMDLDQYTEQQLTDELRRRADLRAQGLCDYCERTPDTSPCRYPERHATPANQWERNPNYHEAFNLVVNGDTIAMVGKQPAGLPNPGRWWAELDPKEAEPGQLLGWADTRKEAEAMLFDAIRRRNKRNRR